MFIFVFLCKIFFCVCKILQMNHKRAVEDKPKKDPHRRDPRCLLFQYTMTMAFPVVFI